MRKSGLFLLLLCISLKVSAYDFEAGGIYYNITSDVDPLTVEVTCEWCHIKATNTYTGDIIVPATVVNPSDGQTYSVTSVGERAFKGDRHNSVTFEQPSMVRKIDASAFAGSPIESILIPNSVQQIASGVFVQCPNLKSVTFQSPCQVKNLEYQAFRECNSLTTIELPNSIESIGAEAFYNCPILETIIFPSSLKNIQTGAFAFCYALKSINIPPLTEYIGFNAFRSCKGLEYVEIPASVDSLANTCFVSCKALKEVTVNWTDPTLVKYEGEAVFHDVLIGNVTLIVPAGMEETYEKAFIWQNFGTISEAIPTFVENTPQTGIFLSSGKGTLEIYGLQTFSVNIYTISGVCIVKDSFEKQFALPAGVYLVRIGDKTLKAIVK